MGQPVFRQSSLFGRRTAVMGNEGRQRIGAPRNDRRGGFRPQVVQPPSPDKFRSTTPLSVILRLCEGSAHGTLRGWTQYAQLLSGGCFAPLNMTVGLDWRTTVGGPTGRVGQWAFHIGLPPSCGGPAGTHRWLSRTHPYSRIARGWVLRTKGVGVGLVPVLPAIRDAWGMNRFPHL